jgi:signal transduction histidine kinase/CheY-like chemotaxis protein/HPt (histidine-containing phosphotransfer) domain-containing protein
MEVYVMPIRARIFIIITVIVGLITLANVVIGISFTQDRLLETIRTDMTGINEIADKFVSTKISLLKSDAATAARHLYGLPAAEMHRVLEEQTNAYEDFMALTVFDRDGIVASYGEIPTPADRLNTSEYLQRAFQGESVISTTRIDAATGELVLHVCVPIDQDRVLSVTLPGMIFSEVLADIRVWESGNVFILDESGTLIANMRDFMVLERYNFIERAKTNPEDRTIGAFFEQMVTGGSGVGTYDYLGIERLCSWKSLTDSALGWSIATVAPLRESPAAGVQNSLILGAVVFFAFGVLGAFLASKSVARPFYLIEQQNTHLEELHELAMSASEAKSSFLANTSHEMRTPLNAVIGLSELTLSGDELKGEARENIEKVYRSGVTLLGIVNDILDLSKIESGKFELIPIEYDIPSIINDTVTLNIIRIGSKPIQFHLHVEGSLPSKLFGDELRVKQIFNNLLSNAFKYTKEGAVDWTITCERDGDSVWLVSSVKDSGIGIRPEDVSKLFSDYNQVDTKSNRSIEGTGLGLSITKKMVEMMDGEITVTSVYGEGSCFTVRLRQKYVSDVVIGDSVAQSLAAFKYFDIRRTRNDKLVRLKLPYAKVLVVDDVLTNLDVARGVLKHYEMQVDCVTSGQKAIDLVRSAEVKYNAIFMDHMMPEMDGIEATRIIREEIGTEYARTVPILALTANAITGNEEIFLAQGFQAFLSKPIDIMAMDAAIRQWVRDRSQESGHSYTPTLAEAEAAQTEAEAATREAAEAERSGLWELDGFFYQKGLERFAGDEEIYLDVVKSFVKNTPPLLEQVRLVTAENLADYAVVVHGIKSSSRSIGAEAVGEQASALELAAKAGDFAIVVSENSDFVKASETLLAGLGAALQTIAAEEQKPEKAEPDAEVLAALREACLVFDIDGVDQAMKELESYEYASGTELIEWIREKVGIMGFKEITSRLS